MLNIAEFNRVAVEQNSGPSVILIGTSFQFSDQLLGMLRFGVEGVRFERVADVRQLFDRERAPRLVVVHEAIDNLEDCVATLRRDLPGALIAVSCSDPAILRRFRTPDHVMPVSALQMNVQVDVWFSILHLLLSGHPYVPAEIELRGGGSPAGVMPASDHAVAGSSGSVTGPAKLTPREMEILPLIAQGKQNKTIASKLGLSVHTVKLHSHNIFSKLGVSNRTGAASWYLSQRMDGSDGTSRPRSDQNR